MRQKNSPCRTRFLPLGALLGLMAWGLPVSGAQFSLKDKHRTIVLTPNETKEIFKMNDRVCLLQQLKVRTCGKVEKIVLKQTDVQMDHLDLELRVGDQVHLVLENQAIAEKGVALTVLKVLGKRRLFNVSVGITAGTNFFYPIFHGQISLARNVVVGVMPLYYKSTSGSNSLSGYGFMATGSYYLRSTYQGWYSTGGLGVTFANSDSTAASESKSLFTAILLGGIRTRWEMGLNIGAAGGFHYMADPNFSAISLEFAGLRVVLLFEVGLTF